MLIDIDSTSAEKWIRKQKNGNEKKSIPNEWRWIDAVDLLPLLLPIPTVSQFWCVKCVIGVLNDDDDVEANQYYFYNWDMALEYAIHE